MPQKDRLESLIEQVEKLADAVMTLTEHQAAQDQRLANGLEGIGKLGSKVGALATAMDRNMEQATAAREAFVRKQYQVAEQVRVMTGSRRPEGEAAPNR